MAFLTDVKWVDVLHAASRRGDVRAVVDLLAAHGGGGGGGGPSTTAALSSAATNDTNVSLLSPSLLAACEGGHADVVERLLAAGAAVADAGAAPSALMAACSGGHVRVVECLLAAGANVRCADAFDDEDGRPTGPLVAASRHGHAAVVDVLIAAGADMALKSARQPGRTHRQESLRRACENGHLQVVQRLVEAEPALNKEQVSALLPVACGSDIYASANFKVNSGHVPLVGWLLERGADLHANDDRALVSASMHGKPAVVARLGAAYDMSRAPNDASRFRWACAFGDVDTVERLLASRDRTLDRESILERSMCLAAENGHVAVVERLLRLGAHIFNGNPEYHGSLDGAARHGHAAVVELLLHAGASLNQRKWALWAAVRGEHTETVDRILAASDHSRVLAPGLSYEAPDDFLTDAAVTGNLTILDRLLLAGGASEQDASVALCVACERGHVALVSRLLHAGVSPHTQNHDTLRTRSRIDMGGDFVRPSNEYVLVSASRAGHLDVVECLLTAGASVHAHAPYRTTPLMAACSNGHLAVAERLIAAGADVHARDDAVLLAIRRNDLDLADDLLNREPSAAAIVIAEDTTDFDAPIHLASISGNAQLVETLLRHGADARRIRWRGLEDTTWPRLVTAVPPTAFATLPEPVQPVWVRCHLRLHARLRPALQRARDRLDRPPRSELGVAVPTREQLIAHLSTAGRRFAREYWIDGIPLFFPDLQHKLGSLPSSWATG